MYFVCRNCGLEFPVDGHKFKCDCGGLFDYCVPSIADAEKLLSLGEPITPMTKEQFGNLRVNLKLDYFMPSGSFKDRGARTLISALNTLGITRIVEDSSGNAGSAIAAYAAAAGLDCHIYVPETASAGKLKQIEAYGAEIVKVPGNRAETSKAVQKACHDRYYASHIYNPLFFEGTQTIVHELVEQMRDIDSIVVPVGNGSLLLGIYRGFAALGKLPKIYGVQSENCGPLHRAFKEQLEHKQNDEQENTGETLAKGIAVQSPPRLPEIIDAVKKSEGDIITVSEDQIINARTDLHKRGIYVETTASVGLAGAIKLFGDDAGSDSAQNSRNDNIVVPLTGSGLKEF